MIVLKIVKPSSSYELALPTDICQQNDGRVCSFWLDGKPIVLQLSSYVRSERAQLKAHDRLAERISKQARQWSIWQADIHPDSTVDQATAQFTDEKGLLWVHSYLVWPHLTVYATISGPEELATNNGNWAFQGVRSLRLTTH